jgi:hypothetical protein
MRILATTTAPLLLASTTAALTCNANVTTGVPAPFPMKQNYMGMYTDQLIKVTLPVASRCVRYDVLCSPFTQECNAQQRRDNAIVTVYTAIPGDYCVPFTDEGGIHFNFHCCTKDNCNDASLPRQKILGPADVLRCEHTAMPFRKLIDITQDPLMTLSLTFRRGFSIKSCARYSITCKSDTKMDCYDDEIASGKVKTIFSISRSDDCNDVTGMYGMKCCNDTNYCASPLGRPGAEHACWNNGTIAAVLGGGSNSALMAVPASHCTRFEYMCEPNDPHCTEQDRQAGAIRTIYASQSSCNASDVPISAAYRQNMLNFYCCKDGELCNDPGVPRELTVTKDMTITCRTTDVTLLPDGTKTTTHWDRRYLRHNHSCAYWDARCDHSSMSGYCTPNEVSQRAVKRVHAVVPGKCPAAGDKTKLDNFYCCDDADMCNQALLTSTIVPPVKLPPKTSSDAAMGLNVPLVVGAAAAGAVGLVAAIGGGVWLYRKHQRQSQSSHQMHPVAAGGSRELLQPSAPPYLPESMKPGAFDPSSKV